MKNIREKGTLREEFSIKIIFNSAAHERMELPKEVILRIERKKRTRRKERKEKKN
jgi:hypothetical protein